MCVCARVTANDSEAGRLHTCAPEIKGREGKMDIDPLGVSL